MAYSPLLTVPNLALFGLASLFLYFFLTFATCRIKSVPGPWHTTFTHYVLKYHVLGRRRMYYIHSLHEKYGPVVRIAPDTIDISDPQAVSVIHKPGGFPKSAWYELFANPIKEDPPPVTEEEKRQKELRAVVKTPSNLFATRDNKTHALQRRLFARAFSNSSLLTNWDDMVRAKVRLAVSKIRAEADPEAGWRAGPVGPAGAGGGADVMKWWTLMASDVVSHLLFGDSLHGLELGKQTPLIDALQKAGFASIISLEFPLVGFIGRHVPWKPVHDLFHADAVADEYGSLAYRNLRSGDANVKNLFSQALASADNAKELEQDHMQHFIEQTVRHESTNFLFAGSDTTAITLTYLVWAVLRQGPRLRDALEAEVAALSPDLAQEELQDRDRAPLLHSVIDETLRLYAAAPSSLPREVPKGGVTLGGYFIPAGVDVSVQAYTLHRDPNAFPNPYEFDGWRFYKKPLTPAQKACLMPYGLGSRVCLGMHLATMELRYAAALFFRECRGARLCPETTDDSMTMMDSFLISPKAHRCMITLDKKPVEMVQA